MSEHDRLVGIHHRSTGDFENPYFRARAFRASRGSSSSGGKPVTTSPSASPKSTSTPLASPRGKSRKVERRSFLSDASISSSPVAHSCLPTPAIPTSTALNNLQDDSSSLGRRPSSVGPSNLESPSSRKSSLTIRAQKLFSISHQRAREDVDKDEPPLSEFKKEHQLKLSSAGSWIEGYFGKKRPSVSKAEALTHESKVVQPPLLKSHQTPLAGSQMTVIASPNPQPLPEKTPTAPLAPRGGLYKLTKRALGIEKDNVAKDDAADTERATSQTTTGENLDKTSNALRKWKETGHSPDSRLESRFGSHRSTTSTSSLSIAGHRLRSRLSALSHSSMNSYFFIPPGKPPTSTPNPQALYTGPDDRQYLIVRLNDQEGPNFLPSEAQRVPEPPLFYPFQDKRKVREFFFDNTPAPDDLGKSTVGAPEDAIVAERTWVEGRPASVKRVWETEWSRVKIAALEAEEEVSREDFVLSVPEHLPSSPMCPRNPRHESGGKGVCVYHGRNLPMMPTDTKTSGTE